jgi:hypothetical protein
MSKITAILEADADGTVHLPVPPELRNTTVRVTATLEAAREAAGAEPGTPLEALKELRKLGTFKEIADPVTWQREQRRDRPLPGRD